MHMLARDAMIGASTKRTAACRIERQPNSPIDGHDMMAAVPLAALLLDRRVWVVLLGVDALQVQWSAVIRRPHSKAHDMGSLFLMLLLFPRPAPWLARQPTWFWMM